MAKRRKDDDLRSDANLGGDWARDTHLGGYGDDYAREGATGVGTAARADAYGVGKPRVKRPKQRRIGKASE